MINLMSPSDRKELSAARSNTLLVRYALLSIIVIVLVIAEIFVATTILETNQTSNQSLVDDNTGSNSSNNEEVQRQADQFRANLSTAKNLLMPKTPYAEILIGIATALPDGVVANNLNISSSSFGSPSTLELRSIAAGKDNEITAALQKATVGGKPIFTSVNRTSSSTINDGSNYRNAYQYQVTYSRGLIE